MPYGDAWAHLQEFVPAAKELEQNHWTSFTPHFILWICPVSYRGTQECQSQCIHQGRYCTPDPDGDLEAGYTGKEIVQVCSSVLILHIMLHSMTGCADLLACWYRAVPSSVGHGIVFEQGARLECPQGAALLMHAAVLQVSAEQPGPRTSMQ